MEDVFLVAGKRDYLIRVLKVFKAYNARIVSSYHHVPCKIFHVIEHVVPSLSGASSFVLLMLFLLILGVHGFNCFNLAFEIIFRYAVEAKSSDLILLSLSLSIHAISHSVLAEDHDNAYRKTSAASCQDVQNYLT